jgi:signal transduction histidine kinase/CheY-like chemotaxis protein
MSAARTILDRVPTGSWRDAQEAEHFVQFYEQDAALVDSVGAYIRCGLESGAAAVVIATGQHWQELMQLWRTQGFDFAAALASGQLVPMDASEVLGRLMRAGRPPRAQFMEEIGVAIAGIARHWRRIVAFCEMVSLLWQSAMHSAAIELEQLWSELAGEHAFTLYCAYPLRECSADGPAFDALCDQHARTLPTECYSALPPKERLRAVSRLQYAARTLERERARRREVERELARCELELREARRHKDEFLALLAHELRNPLAPIRYAVATTRTAGCTAAQERRAQEIIERQVAHMSRLLDDLLDVSRITHSTLELRKSRVELTALIAAAIETARPMLDAKRHTLSLQLPSEPVRLEGDAVRLAQIFANLLTNAAQYTNAEGHVELGARLDGDAVVVSVRDNGIGISPEMMSKLFIPFSQARPALERSEGGLGIGLALVRGLTALHGGTVEAHSEGTGHGSEFTVRLPLAASGAPQSDAGERVDRAPRLRLLIADDNCDSAESCAALLELCGHEVHTAHAGRRALELAETLHPEVVLLDIGMPDLNGYQVAESIRAAPWGQQMILVAVTGWGQEEDKRRALAAGFDHHLTKPVDGQTLESLVSRCATVLRAARG